MSEHHSIAPLDNMRPVNRRGIRRLQGSVSSRFPSAWTDTPPHRFPATSSLARCPGRLPMDCRSWRASRPAPCPPSNRRPSRPCSSSCPPRRRARLHRARVGIEPAPRLIDQGAAAAPTLALLAMLARPPSVGLGTRFWPAAEFGACKRPISNARVYSQARCGCVCLRGNKVRAKPAPAMEAVSTRRMVALTALARTSARSPTETIGGKFTGMPLDM